MGEFQSDPINRTGGVNIDGGNVTVEGDIVGRDIIKNIINEGPTLYFVNDYEPLQDAYIEPWSIFARTHLDHFSGREWLLDKVDSFLRTHDCGYFVLEAEAGLGKTTFLAWLARERGYIHHFVELAPGPDGVETGLKNLAAQLILAYKLGSDAAKNVVPKAATRSDYLSKLLKQAADHQLKAEKIVLIIDALDLAGIPQDQNVLGLPTTLPKGIFIIVSQRPIPVTLQVEASTTPCQVCYLKANSVRNQIDIRLFLEEAVTWSGIAQALQKSGYTAKRFTQLLLKRSGGIWVYLHYVIYEVEQSGQFSANLMTLPLGLTKYYTNIWRRWCKKREWLRIYLPLLATLAAAREGLTIDRLARWAGLPKEKQKISRLLNEDWRPFLAIAGRGRQARYSFYHATLHEFFQGRISPKSLPTAEKTLLEEVKLATSDARQRIIKLLHKEMYTAKKPQARRDAAFSLIRMDWLGHGRSITPDEMLAYLELVARYVDTSFERRYLVRHITIMLDTQSGILSPRQQAQLLVYRAAMLGELGELDEAAKDYDKAGQLTGEIIESESCLPEDYRFAARVNLGAGVIAVSRAETLTERKDAPYMLQLLNQAVESCQAGAKIAEVYNEDVVLSAGIYQELNCIYVLLSDWHKAEEYYRKAFQVLQRIKDQDPKAYAWRYAEILEAASDTHLKKGQNLVLNQDGPSAVIEYETAYRYAGEEICLLRQHLGDARGENLMYAYMNAGESLWQMSKCTDCRERRPQTKARLHWQKALRLAQQLGMSPMAQIALESLNRSGSDETDPSDTHSA